MTRTAQNRTPGLSPKIIIPNAAPKTVPRNKTRYFFRPRIFLRRNVKMYA